MFAAGLTSLARQRDGNCNADTHTHVYLDNSILCFIYVM